VSDQTHLQDPRWDADQTALSDHCDEEGDE
jgi:hypothetical protein